jgi:hypothetical protein
VQPGRVSDETTAHPWPRQDTMFPTTGSLASLVAFLPVFVAAIPNAPAPTPAAYLDKRQNGPNTIGFSLSGTSCKWPSPHLIVVPLRHHHHSSPPQDRTVNT